MKYRRVVFACMAIALFLWGCNGDDGEQPAPNNPPVAVDDTAVTNQGAAVVLNVTANDTDDDGNIDPTTVTIVTGPNSGTVNVNATTGAVTYTPAATFFGTVSFTYTVNDNDGATSNVATVRVTVTPAPDQDFVSAVKQILTLDPNTDPVDINGITFRDQFIDDETAFDDVF
jgi:hypothetical protein